MCAFALGYDNQQLVTLIARENGTNDKTNVFNQPLNNQIWLTFSFKPEESKDLICKLSELSQFMLSTYTGLGFGMIFIFQFTISVN